MIFRLNTTPSASGQFTLLFYYYFRITLCIQYNCKAKERKWLPFYFEDKASEKAQDIRDQVNRPVTRAWTDLFAIAHTALWRQDAEHCQGVGLMKSLHYTSWETLMSIAMFINGQVSAMVYLSTLPVCSLC